MNSSSSNRGLALARKLLLTVLLQAVGDEAAVKITVVMILALNFGHAGTEILSLVSGGRASNESNQQNKGNEGSHICVVCVDGLCVQVVYRYGV